MLYREPSLHRRLLCYQLTRALLLLSYEAHIARCSRAGNAPRCCFCDSTGNREGNAKLMFALVNTFAVLREKAAVSASSALRMVVAVGWFGVAFSIAE